MSTNKTNIALIGFMGAGKSLTASALAQDLGLEVVSTDALIENQQGISIVEIFKQFGETHFRQLEKGVIASLAGKKDFVLDCGGGIVLDAENIKQLKALCTVVYLSISAEQAYDRLKDSADRPLLNVDDPQQRIKELLDKRVPLYKNADLTVNTDGKSVQEVADEIKALLKK